jgi:hypothetical protein
MLSLASTASDSVGLAGSGVVTPERLAGLGFLGVTSYSLDARKSPTERFPGAESLARRPEAGRG